MEYTKGPWYRSKSGTCVDLPNGSQIRIIRLADGQSDVADAQLISAAPDMLRALERCRIYLSACNEKTFPANFIECVEGAIAKAKGLK